MEANGQLFMQLGDNDRPDDVLASRRLSRAEAQHEHQAIKREHEAQRRLVEESIRRHAVNPSRSHSRQPSADNPS